MPSFKCENDGVVKFVFKLLHKANTCNEYVYIDAPSTTETERIQFRADPFRRYCTDLCQRFSGDQSAYTRCMDNCYDSMMSTRRF